MSIYLGNNPYVEVQESLNVDYRLNALEDEMLTTYKNTASIPANAIANFSISNTEFQYLNGVTSNIQTQLNDIRQTIAANPNADTGPISEAEYLTLDGSLTNTTLQAQINQLKSDIGSVNLTIGSGAITTSEFLALDGINTTKTIQAQINTINTTIGSGSITTHEFLTLNNINTTTTIQSQLDTMTNRIDNLPTSSSAAGLPAGTILFYGSNANAPSGFLRCDGARVSRATYANLFAVIGELYTPPGESVSSTQFYLPDLRGLFVRGTGNSGTYRGSDFLNDKVEGESVGVFQNQSLENHRHAYQACSAEIRVAQTSSGSNSNVVFDNVLSTSNTGDAGDGRETRPYNMSLWYIIKY